MGTVPGRVLSRWRASAAAPSALAPSPSEPSEGWLALAALAASPHRNRCAPLLRPSHAAFLRGGALNRNPYPSRFRDRSSCSLAGGDPCPAAYPSAHRAGPRDRTGPLAATRAEAGEPELVSPVVPASVEQQMASPPGERELVLARALGSAPRSRVRKRQVRPR